MQDTPVNDIRIGKISYQWALAQKLPCHFYEKTDSTNTQAKKAAFEEASFNEQLILYFAEAQTAGRGRGQNSWLTPSPGSQLLSTWSFMLDEPLHPGISPLTGLALYRAAVATWPFLNFSLKAPNDLYINENKVAGLLLETISQGNDHRLLIGLGLNVTAFPKEIHNSCSLLSSLPKKAPLLAQDWITFLERLLFEFSFSLQLAHENLNSTSCEALLTALNNNPNLTEKFTGIDAEANLSTAKRSISWTEL